MNNNRNRTFSKNQLTIIEFETRYENYTGILYGYKIKAEYAYKKTQSESIYHQISVVCRNIMPNSPQINVEVLVECSQLGIVEKSRFITTNLLKDVGVKDFCAAIVAEAYGKSEILRKCSEKEAENK